MGYTTRVYNLDGSTVWSGDYFQGMPTLYSSPLASVTIYADTPLPANTYSNGTAGVGATLGGTATGALIVNGYTVLVGDTVLVCGEANPANNGIYTCNLQGSFLFSYQLTRRTDFDQASEIVPGIVVYSAYGARTYQLSPSTGTVTVGATALNFARVTGTYGKSIFGTCCDANNVYVWGSRVTNSVPHTWSVVAFDITSGKFLWDYDLGARAIKCAVDPSGNLVCMVNINSDDTLLISGGTTTYTQTFKVLSPSGSLVRTVSFTQQTASFDVTAAVRTIDFAINESGDYHVLGYYQYPYYELKIYEWFSPQSGTPTLRSTTGQKANANAIIRAGGRDLFPTNGGYDSILANGSRIPGNQYPEIARGKAQQAAPQSASDLDLLIPETYFSTSLTRTVVTPTGTTQATALTLSAGNNYALTPPALTPAYSGLYSTTPSYTAGAGLILPSGSIGDLIGLQYGNTWKAVPGCPQFCVSVDSLGNYSVAVPPNTDQNIWIYPPVGGKISNLAANTPVNGYYGQVFICLGGNNWMRSHSDEDENGSWVTVDSSGNVLASVYNQVLPGFRKWDSSGKLLFQNSDVVANIITDNSNNWYAASDGGTDSYASLFERNSSGSWKWGHRHLSIPTPAFKPFLAIDPTGTYLTMSASGRANRSQDVNWLADLTLPISIGRTATAMANGIGGDYTLSFSGSPPVPGTWVVASVADNSGLGEGISISGATFLPAIDATTSYGGSRIYWAQIQYGSTGIFKVRYTGTASTDSSSVVITEILNVDPTFSIAFSHVRNASTSPAVTTFGTRAVAVIAVGDVASGSSNFSAPPGSFTSAGRKVSTTMTVCTTAIATQSFGTGTVTPGAWSNPETTNSALATIIFN